MPDFLTIASLLIKGFESCELEAYPDPGTKREPITIGWGCTQKLDGSPWHLGDHITQEEADALFDYQLKQVYLPALEQIPNWSKLTNNQKAALLSFAWNNGPYFYNTEGFATITKLLNQQQFDPSYVDYTFTLYRNPGTDMEDGLRDRRIIEAQLFCKPDNDSKKTTASSNMPAIFRTIHQTFLKTEPHSASLLPPEKKVELPENVYFKATDFQPAGKHYKLVLEAQTIAWERNKLIKSVSLPAGEWYAYGSPQAADPHVEVYLPPSLQVAAPPLSPTAIPTPLATFKMRLPAHSDDALITGTFDLVGTKKPRQFTCTSGARGYQYRGSTHIKGKAPLPSCQELGIENYWILTEQLERFQTKGIEGYAFWIQPDPVEIRGVMRGEFMVHNDTNRSIAPGSSGCIVFLFDNGWNIWRDCMAEFRAAGIAKIPLKVIYS
jgi:lysozyme